MSLAHRATLRLRRIMTTVIYNPASVRSGPTCNKLAPAGRPQTSSVGANYYDSAHSSPIRAMLPLVEIRHPLDPVALAPERLLPDAIPSVLASRAVPKAARNQVLPNIKIAKRPYGTAKIRFKRSKSTLQRGAGRAPIHKTAAFANIQHPKSNIPASAAEPVIMCGYTRTTGRETIKELQ